MNPRYGTQNVPTSTLTILHVSTLEAEYTISVSVSADILFKPCGMFPFLLGC